MSNIWEITATERTKHREKFLNLNPVDGFIMGDQAKSFMMKSQLPMALLGKIWTLSDRDVDGRLSEMEFGIACKLITLCLKGHEIPDQLPHTLLQSLTRTDNFVNNVKRDTAMSANEAISKSHVEETSISTATRLRYTQKFNEYDISRSGYLSGIQARNVLVQNGLPNHILAQIWTLADMDKDGCLTCNEFIIASHLCDLAKQGTPVPPALPPSILTVFKRQSSVDSAAVAMPTLVTAQADSFEERKRENYNRGQAELERRRRVLEDQQRAEREERERKERVAQEEAERLRAEQEQKRLAEMERQLLLQKQRQQDEEETKRMMEERQRVQWEASKRVELETARERQQESLAQLRSHSDKLSEQLNSADEKSAELTHQITLTRSSVTEVKAAIDGMRVTRDRHMEALSTLKSRLREQNNRLLEIAQESSQIDSSYRPAEGVMAGDDSKTRLLEELSHTAEAAEAQAMDRERQVEASGEALEASRIRLLQLLDDCRDTYERLRAEQTAYKQKSHIVNSVGSGKIPHKALFDFVGRSEDELSFSCGDVIMINMKAITEPDWLEGDISGRIGLLPSNYVAPMDSRHGSIALSTNSGVFARQESIVSNHDFAITNGHSGSVSHYVSLYSYSSEEPGDLTFDQGQVIEVTNMDGDWWSGRIGDRAGIFPSNYVEPFVEGKKTIETESQPEPADEKVQRRKGQAAIVLAPFEASSAEQLSLTRGQLVMVFKQSESGWWEGEIQTRGKQRQVGWFPASFVRLKTSRRMSLPDDVDPVIPSTACIPDGDSTSKDSVVAVYDYTSQYEDELSFHVGDVIIVINKDDMHWWKGECNGTVGLFPSNYVAPKFNQ